MILGVVNATETIDSSTQPELPHSGLQNNAERESEDRPGALLERKADQATALMLAEAATQDHGSAMAVEEGDVTAGGSTGHISDKLAVETGMDGTPVAAAVWVDAQKKTRVECRTKSAGCDPMEVKEAKQVSWSEAEKSSAADLMHKRLLDQMDCLCRTVQIIGVEWKGKSHMKALRRNVCQSG